MKKTVLLIVVFFLAAVMLTGCGGTGDNAGSGTIPPADGSANDAINDGTGTNDDNKPAEILTRAQILEKIGVTTGPAYLVVRYNGNGENPPLYGASECYIIFKIFNDDGTPNALGTSETWYIYDDQAGFDAGYANVSGRDDLSFKDRDHLSSLYYVMKSSIFGSRADYSTYDELVGLIDSNSSLSGDYSTYEVVR